MRNVIVDLRKVAERSLTFRNFGFLSPRPGTQKQKMSKLAGMLVINSYPLIGGKKHEK
jgi:hypothetical protein